MNILEGIKVIDVTAWAFVPSAGGVMAHWGAEVIKVESPTAPDPMRLMDGSLEPGRSSAMFKHYSRGKRSIAINLASDEGRELLYRLAADADVFLTSYLAPTRKKLGMDVDDIRRVNPNIIYARGSGHGPHGPDADRPGFDVLSWWYRGSLGQTGMDMTGEDWPIPMIGHGDGMAGLALAGGICAALLRRARTGEAGVVDSSLMGTAIWFNAPALLAAQRKPAERRFPPARRKLPPGISADMIVAVRGIYQTKDGRFINLLFMGDDDRDFADLCERIERHELASDPRFATSKARTENKTQLLAILEEIFAARTLAEWKQVLANARGPWAPVQTPEEIFDDPQTEANGFMCPVDYPDGPLLIPSPAVQFDGESGAAPRAPDFAEHTDAILAELGCTPGDVARYREAGVVA